MARGFAELINSHARLRGSCSRSGLVDALFHSVLEIALELLTLALDFLRRAFTFHRLIIGRFADALLDLAGGFVGGTLDFIACASHDSSLLRCRMTLK